MLREWAEPSGMADPPEFAEAAFPFDEPDEVVDPTPLAPGRLPSYIRDHRKRLRVRFLASNAMAVPDYELLELVLFRAIPRQDVKPLARRLLESFGDFNVAASARWGTGSQASRAASPGAASPDAEGDVLLHARDLRRPVPRRREP